MYIDWSHLSGKYPVIAKDFDSSLANSYWIPGAENEVNSRLAVRYSVPFSPCPDMVKDLVVDLTYYKMTYRQENQDKLKEYLDERFKGLADGTIALVTSVSVAQNPSNFAWASNSYHTSFGPDCVENWQVSSQWIEDTRSARGVL
jgi:phage gp36-like protein